MSLPIGQSAEAVSTRSSRLSTPPLCLKLNLPPAQKLSSVDFTVKLLNICRTGEIDVLLLVNVAGEACQGWRDLISWECPCFLAGTTLTLEMKRCQLDGFKSTSYAVYHSFSEANVHAATYTLCDILYN